MRKSGIAFLVTLSLVTASIQARGENQQPAIEGPSPGLTSHEDQDIKPNAPVLSDSELLSQAGMSQLDLKTLREIYDRTAFGQESLPKGNVDFSSITTNYFNIDDLDALSMKTSETAEPLKIVDYGPRGLLPIEMRKPTIYVQFNQPMVPISKLGESLKKNSIMTITPKVPGTYRWYGTKILSFEPDSPMHRNRSYSVRISKKATSIHGKELGMDHEYVFLSEFLKMLSLMFGPWESLHDAQTEVPPNKARQILVIFNQTVDPESIGEHIQVARGKKSIP